MDEKFRVIDGELYELRGQCQPERCGAWCCRNLLFKLKVQNLDDIEYFRLHGCSVVERGDELFVLVPKDCENLDKSSLTCMLYEGRPRVCEKYAKKDADIFKSDACGLVWKRVHGRRAQVIMKRMRDG